MPDSTKESDDSNPKKPSRTRKATSSRKKSDHPTTRRKAISASAKKSRASKTKPGNEKTTWRNKLSGLTNSAVNVARKTTGGSIKMGKTILKNKEQLKEMGATGQSLKDLREVAGLTISELSEAINLKDKSLLEAVENGTATLSFELILRLAALLARNDPIPFIIKYTRTYNPDVWRILNDWGLGRLPLHYERERKFINIYRRHDAARALSDQDYERVLAFTNKAFEMALHFAAESQENHTKETEVDEGGVSNKMTDNKMTEKKEDIYNAGSNKDKEPNFNRNRNPRTHPKNDE